MRDRPVRRERVGACGAVEPIGPNRPPEVRSTAMERPDTYCRLGQCYGGIVHDVMRGLGMTGFVLPPELRPLIAGNVLAGPAFTIEGRPVAADPHETLLAWTGLLSMAPSGSVWVCQPNDRTIAQMGELSAETLLGKGVKGCVIDGLIRDVRFLKRLGFNAWSRGCTPRDIVGVWRPTSVMQTIRIGDVEIAGGDAIFADEDGIIRIPAKDLVQVVDLAEAAATKENLVRKAILSGEDPQQAYLKYRKF
jgi:regulator of RNase E activity RraA